MDKAHNLLTEGLQKGFAGATDKTETNRGGFPLTSSHYESELGTYHDEWVTGGGQEMVRTADGTSMTRTYVGDTISQDKLESLGITEKDVMKFLKTIIIDHGDKIRFDEYFEFTSGDWEYVYNVTERLDDPFIINGTENIYYKGTFVFRHTFGISKVTES